MEEYYFEIGDLVKTKYKHSNRMFRVVFRDRLANDRINEYYLESIDNDLDLDLWPINFYEYQSLLRKLNYQELEDYETLLLTKTYNL